jgi:hypothetical protein
MQLGRLLLMVGLAIFVLGLVVMLAEKLGFGRLPGDLVFKRKNLTVYFPLVSSIVLSIVATLLLNLFRK